MRLAFRTRHEEDERAMSSWNPDQYARFGDERRRPFDDLLGMVEPAPGMRVIDLGCGTGELTRVLHERLAARETIGLDSSPAMLARSDEFATPGLRFELGDIATYETAEQFDLVFSNAALQWVDDHPGLLARLTSWLAPGGQIAVQVPANDDHPSHRVAGEVAGEEPFRSELDGYSRVHPILTPVGYAEVLNQLSYSRQRVELRVYGHHLESREAVVEWVRGTLLTAYQERLAPASFERFLDVYRERLRAALPDQRPFFYPFKRILFWARR